MATLPQISFDGGPLSSDTGTLLFREFDETVGFLKTIAEHLHLKDNRLYYIHSNDHTTAEYHFEATEYQAKSWDIPRKVIVQSVRQADELFFTHSFFITNLGMPFRHGISSKPTTSAARWKTTSKKRSTGSEWTRWTAIPSGSVTSSCLPTLS